MIKKKERAVVLGGGYTGLLAAKVLSEHFKKVIILERDSKILSESILPRIGTPQGGYAHFLIPIGLNALEKLIPGFTKELVRNGAKQCDLYGDVRYLTKGICKPRFKSDRKAYLMGRPLVDKVIRDFIEKCSNISFQYDTEVKGFLCDQKKQKISGVRLKNKISQQETELFGDLIVDATGPSSRCSEWLEENGFTKPPVEEVQIAYNQLAYRARWRDDFKPDWMYSIHRNLGLRQGGYFMNIEDDKEGKTQWLFAVVTHFGEPLEKRKEDFVRLSLELENATFSDAVKNATPLTEIGQYKVPKIRRKIFSQMNPLPQGFIAIGDAQCIWPPHTGLGLAVGALDTLALKEVLENEDISNVTEDYFSISEKTIDKLWVKNILQEVIPLKGTKKLSLFLRFLCWYKKKLGEYSTSDQKLWRVALLFGLNERSVKSLFRPSVILRMLTHVIKN